MKKIKFNQHRVWLDLEKFTLRQRVKDYIKNCFVWFKTGQVRKNDQD